MRICDVNSLYSDKGGGIRVYHNRKLEYFSGQPRHTAALVIPGKDCSLIRNGNTRVYTLQSVPLSSSGYRIIVDSGGLNSVFLDYRPDIVEIGSPYLLPALARRALGDSRIPTVGFYHSDFPESYVGPYAEKLFPAKVTAFLKQAAENHVSRYYGRMTAVFAASKCMLAKLYDVGVRRLFYTPLGVDTETFSPSAATARFRREVGAADGSMLVLYLARLHSEKGLDLLMEAYPLFREPGRIKLVIGGRGPHEGLVQKFTGKYPEVQRLSWQMGRDAVAEAMASSDVFLSLGRYETFGLAGLEAIAAGTVPVFPDTGASGEMSSSLGLLPAFEAGNPESLANAVVEALKITGRETVEYLRDFAVSRHSWRTVFERIETYYRMIVDASSNEDIDRLHPPGRWWDRE